MEPRRLPDTRRHAGMCIPAGRGGGRPAPAVSTAEAERDQEEAWAPGAGGEGILSVSPESRSWPADAFLFTEREVSLRGSVTSLAK